MFEWSEAFRVQIGSIDAQHRSLFGIAHELHTALIEGHGKSALAKALDHLIRYTSAHFAHEERLMRLNGYPHLAAHKAEHDALTRQVLRFQADFERGKAALTVQLLQFLEDWLQKHIKGSDMRYGPCLRRSKQPAVGARSQTY